MNVLNQNLNKNQVYIVIKNYSQLGMDDNMEIYHTMLRIETQAISKEESKLCSFKALDLNKVKFLLD